MNSSDSDETIMSVAELIDTAFGRQEVNVVNHKLLQTILYLLARQLRVLERRVVVQIGPLYTRSSSSLSVTELKLHAMLKKKTKPKLKTGSTPAGDKILTEKTSPEVKVSTKKATIKTPDETSAGKTATDKTTRQKSKPDKTTSDKTSSDKTSSDKTSTDKSSSDKTSTDKSSSGKAVTDKTLVVKDQPADTEPSGPQDYQKLLETIEELRERELRIIHQRAESWVEHEKTPTPMASLDSVEATYEKLLVVERIPIEEAEARTAREKSGTRSTQAGPRLSIVTQDQFQELALAVRQLEEKFGPVGVPGFPENAQLMNELRKGASLTDAMAAMQLSARLEAAEKTIKNVLSLVTVLARQTGVNLGSDSPDDIEVLFGVAGDKTRQSMSKGKSSSATRKMSQLSSKSKKGLGVEASETGSPSRMSLPQSAPQLDTSVTKTDGLDQEVKKDRVTYDELDAAIQELHSEIMKKVKSSITRSSANADTALKIANNLEGKIESSLDLGNRMEDLEHLVSTYVEQINVLDTGLSSQMTNYQEELTQMQHDLEVGLETMADVLANAGGDATAVAEMNAHFSDLQAHIDETVLKQTELRDNQTGLAVNLDALRKQIELLRETKADREEVVDALRDKAGLGALNGLVSEQQFAAVRGDFEKRIATAYDKFNNQEIVWQKAIDDLLREFNEKADLVQVQGLRDEIYRYLTEFRSKVKFIMDIVGEPSAAALSKRLNRDTACLSCAAPAHMKPEETSGTIMPAMRPQTVGSETPKPKGDGDHGVCIPGQPIPHPRDPRSHVCQRWCGGSHTVVNNALSRAPPGVIIIQANRTVTTEEGVDGKMYAVDKPRVPCSQCVLPAIPPSPEPSEHQADLPDGGDTDTLLMPYHMCPGYVSYSEPEADHFETPPATADSD